MTVLLLCKNRYYIKGLTVIPGGKPAGVVPEGDVGFLGGEAVFPTVGNGFLFPSPIGFNPLTGGSPGEEGEPVPDPIGWMDASGGVLPSEVLSFPGKLVNRLLLARIMVAIDLYCASMLTLI